jgi:hypothetical protein
VIFFYLFIFFLREGVMSCGRRVAAVLLFSAMSPPLLLAAVVALWRGCARVCPGKDAGAQVNAWR